MGWSVELLRDLFNQLSLEIPTRGCFFFFCCPAVWECLLKLNNLQHPQAGKTACLYLYRARSPQDFWPRCCRQLLKLIYFEPSPVPFKILKCTSRDIGFVSAILTFCPSATPISSLALN